MTAKYRKKPVEIEAIQWNGQNRIEIAKFIKNNDLDDRDILLYPGDKIFINTLEGTMCANIGDWIIRGIKGEFYPCKPDIFEATYELV